MGKNYPDNQGSFAVSMLFRTEAGPDLSIPSRTTITDPPYEK
jgi:hypothetical protein